MQIHATPVSLTSGDHVAAVWFYEENNELQWYLGIVSETAQVNNLDDKIRISYLYRSGTSASVWKFPEAAQEIQTPFKNILHHSFPARYECISVIKCIINNTELERIEAVFKEYLSQINDAGKT